MATLPSPRTWVTGEVVSAAYMNSNVRDSVNFLLNMPHAEIYSTANQSIAAATTTFVTFAATTEDSDNMANLTTGRLYPQTAGRYLVQGQASWDATSTGGRGVFIIKNGATYYTSTNVQANGSDQTRMQTSRTIRVAVGDNITLVVYTTVAASLVTNSYGSSFVSASFVGT